MSTYTFTPILEPTRLPLPCFRCRESMNTLINIINDLPVIHQGHNEMYNQFLSAAEMLKNQFLELPQHFVCGPDVYVNNEILFNSVDNLRSAITKVVNVIINRNMFRGLDMFPPAFM